MVVEGLGAGRRHRVPSELSLELPLSKDGRKDMTDRRHSRGKGRGSESTQRVKGAGREPCKFRFLEENAGWFSWGQAMQSLHSRHGNWGAA